MKYEKYQSFLSENFQFLEVKFSLHLNRPVFVMFTQSAKHETDTYMISSFLLCLKTSFGNVIMLLWLKSLKSNQESVISRKKKMS